jgi:hypothetical protein
LFAHYQTNMVFLMPKYLGYRILVGVIPYI